VDPDVELAGSASALGSLCDSLRPVVGVSVLLHNESTKIGAWEVPHLHLGRCPTSTCLQVR
jgi:hypothetical protein